MEVATNQISAAEEERTEENRTEEHVLVKHIKRYNYFIKNGAQNLKLTKPFLEQVQKPV